MNTNSALQVKRLVRVAQTALLLVSAVIIFGNGCSEGGFYPEANNSQDLSSTLNATCKDPNVIDVIPGAKTAALVGATNILQHYAACTGLTVVSSATSGVYDAKVGSVSTYGAVNSVTGPMMMAAHSIAGEVCNDVIDQELASGVRIFAGWNLSASVLPGQDQLSTAMDNMALSCYQNYEVSAEEKSILIGEITSSVGSTEVNASRKAAVMLCTSMLASLNAMMN